MREDILSFAVRPRVLGHYLGSLLMVTGVLMFAPAGFALIAPDWAACWHYGLTAVLVAGLGYALQARLPLSPKLVMQANEAMVIVAAIFLLTPVIFALPMSARGVGYGAAFFQIVSDLTTSGFSVVPVAHLPLSFWLTSAWLQWVGGLGITVLFFGLVSGQVLNIRRLSGVLDDHRYGLQGGIKGYVRQVLTVYVALTLLVFLLLLVCGEPAPQAATLAMAALASGWSQPAQVDLSQFPRMVALIVALGSLLGAVTMVLYVVLAQGQWRRVWRDMELRLLLFMVAAGGIAISLILWLQTGQSLASALWQGVLLAMSAQSTAGFSPMPTLGQIPSSALVLLIVLMFIGGSVGSTAGGIKLIRAWLSLRVVLHLIQSTRLPPHAVHPLRVEGRRVELVALLDTLALVMLTLGVTALSWLAFLWAGEPALPALFDVVSAIGTVGLADGLIGPHLPASLMGVLCVDMWFGRLEFLAFLVLFTPRTWMGRRMA